MKRAEGKNEADIELIKAVTRWTIPLSVHKRRFFAFPSTCLNLHIGGGKREAPVGFFEAN